MDTNNRQEKFDVRVETFRQDYLKGTGAEPTEKMLWFFRKGMEKQTKETDAGHMAIAGERFFDDDDVLLSDDEHYPCRLEFKACKSAFMRGYQVQI